MNIETQTGSRSVCQECHIVLRLSARRAYYTHASAPVRPRKTELIPVCGIIFPSIPLPLHVRNEQLVDCLSLVGERPLRAVAQAGIRRLV